jgi:alpha-amylase
VFIVISVRVYGDAVINHMTSSGNDIQDHRTYSGDSCNYWYGRSATAQSPYFTHGFTYHLNPNTQQRPALEYPAVPYNILDFHCQRKIRNWSDPHDLNFGWLSDLADLKTESPKVQDRLASHLVDLLSIGMSGFRIDAAKHIAPKDLASILGRGLVIWIF